MVGLLAALTGCGGEAAPHWAVEHGTVDVASASIDGYQVWEFFGRKWNRKRSDKQHICSLVQDLSGTLVSDLDGCQGCVATYRVQVSELESDCASGVADEPDYGGVRYLAVGDVPTEQRDLDPYPGRTLGWYLSWDGQVSEFMGFAWQEDVGTADDPHVQGWSPGERYILDPVYAWQL